jgi:hypothetical protein
MVRMRSHIIGWLHAIISHERSPPEFYMTYLRAPGTQQKLALYSEKIEIFKFVKISSLLRKMSSSQWKQYPSMNNERTTFDELPEGEMFVVTEKIDGSNLAVEWTADGEIECFSRNIKLDEEATGNFNAHLTLIPDFLSRLPKLDKPTVIYGEIYNHGMGTRYNNSPPKFCAFDVKQEGVYLPFYEARDLCLSIGIPFVKTIFEGTAEDVWEWVKQNVSTMQSSYSDSPILAEGVVFRSVTKERFLVKSRTKPYLERAHGIRPPPDRTAQQAKILMNETISSYLTEQRLKNLHSKMIGKPPLSKDTIGEWVALFEEDVRREMTLDGNDTDPATLKVLRKLCTSYLFKHLMSGNKGVDQEENLTPATKTE